MIPAQKTLDQMTPDDLVRNWGDYLNPRAFSANVHVQFIDKIGHCYLNALTQKVGSSVFPTSEDMEFVGMLPVFNADRSAVFFARKFMALGEALNVVIPLARPVGILTAGIVRFAVFMVALVVQLPFVFLALCWEMLVAAKRAIRQDDIIEALQARIAALEAHAH